MAELRPIAWERIVPSATHRYRRFVVEAREQEDGTELFRVENVGSGTVLTRDLLLIFEMRLPSNRTPEDLELMRYKSIEEAEEFISQWERELKPPFRRQDG